jgi:2-polyprenyl-3-methyl-5-hydroxy-6-metoxy-1,4-benzoquinol methylase
MQNLKRLYNKKYFRDSRKYQFRNARFDYAISIMEKIKARRILDVGCGLGTLVKRLRDYGYDAHGIDFADTLRDDFGMKQDHFKIADVTKGLPYKDKSFDVVISTDFFEHIEEKDIDYVFEEMQRVGDVVMVFAASKAWLTKNQKKYHIVNKPVGWWHWKLRGAIFV